MAVFPESNQFLFVVFFALVLSGVIRVGLESRECGLRQEPCVCAGQREVLDLMKANSLTQLNASELPEGPLTGISGPAWLLPKKLATVFLQKAIMDPSKFKLHIKLLTYDRLDSAERCLRSLEDAHYDGDTVDLDIFVDHPFNEERSKWTWRSEARVAASHELLDKLDTLPWSHGSKKVLYRSRNGGIQPQWLEAWWPESLNDFGFIVEDDMELSPMFYRYFKHVVRHYYYNPANYNPRAYGISFQRQFFVAGEGTRPMHHTGPFLYQLVGTWGQFLFPGPWRDFRKWYDLRRYNESRQPVLQGLKTTQWWYNKGNKLWTPWIIKWAHARNMYNIYPTFPGNLSLSISHREIGSNFRHKRKADASLLTAEDFENAVSDWWALPSMRSLKQLDYCLRPVQSGAPASTLEELHALLNKIYHEKAKDKSVALIMVPPGGYDIIRNWLCHVEGLALRNYVLVLTNPDDADDLAGRGHPVFLLPQVEDSHQQKPKQLAKSWEPHWSKGHLELVLSVLALGYGVLICNPDAIWHSNPFDNLLARKKEFDMQGVLDSSDFSNSFLYLKNSPKVTASWQSFVRSNPATVVHPEGELGVSFKASLLLGGKLSFRVIDSWPFASLEDANVSSSVVPVVLGRSARSKDEKISNLTTAGLWALDDYDLACKFVRCHKKVSVP